MPSDFIEFVLALVLNRNGAAVCRTVPVRSSTSLSACPDSKHCSRPLDHTPGLDPFGVSDLSRKRVL